MTKISGYPDALIISYGDSECINEIVHQGDITTMQREWDTITKPESFYQGENWETMVIYKAIAVKQIQPAKSKMVSEVL